MIRFRDQPSAPVRFADIVKWACRYNPFYAEWITDPRNPPILERSVFAANNDQILNGHESTHRTSGSTAEPARIHKSDRVGQLQERDVNRLIGRLGGRLRVAIIRETWSGVEGPGVIDLMMPIDLQIDEVLRLRREGGIEALTTYPTNIEQLVLRIRERGIDLSFLKRVGLYAEMITPDQLRLVKETFPHAQFWSTYSSAEFGIIGAGCFTSEQYYHLMIHRLGIEIVDGDGSPVEPGTPGRVLVTDFTNRECPFIRYDTGDTATWEPSGCTCDTLPTIHTIYGKTRGAFLHRSGDRIVWSTLATAMRDMPGMRQFQVVQEKVERFVVRIVCTERIDRLIRAAFRDHFGYMPRRLIVSYVNEIPRDASGKLHNSRCLV